MYGIPVDIDFQFLVGNTVSEVRKFPQSDSDRDGSYIILMLTEDRQIHIEGGYDLSRNEMKSDKSIPIESLKGCMVRSVDVKSASILVIQLTNGLRLTLYDDSKEYECIQIYPEGIIILIKNFQHSAAPDTRGLAPHGVR